MADKVAKEFIEAAQGYEDLFVPALFGPWTGRMIEAAGIGPGSDVLDVACGTGVLARDALATVGTGGHVVGADPAPGMLAVAEGLEPAIEWSLCPAESLEVDDASFDCVVSQFGMMFFEDRLKAAEEMLRVLRPRGSVAIAVWRSVPHNPAYADLIAVLEQEIGTAAAEAVRLPFKLGDTGEVAAVLEQAGFEQVDVADEAGTATFPSSRHVAEADLRGWLPLFDIFLNEEQIDAVLARSEQRLSRYVEPSGEATFPTAAHIYTARKPL